VPLLRIDGLALVQTKAIVRYLAEKHGLRGATPAEVATCDMVPSPASRPAAESSRMSYRGLVSHAAAYYALYPSVMPPPPPLPPQVAEGIADWKDTIGGSFSRGRRSHSSTALCIVNGESLMKYAGRRANDFSTHA
jgi:hypothetical protein